MKSHTGKNNNVLDRVRPLTDQHGAEIQSYGTANQLDILEQASHIDLGFPYDLYEKELPRTFIYGGLRDQILV